MLLLDVGNTHTHAGLATHQNVFRHEDFETGEWSEKRIPGRLSEWLEKRPMTAVVFCSVVPEIVPRVHALARSWKLPELELNHRSIRGVGIDYPRPSTIGADRLANALAVRRHYGAPAVVVDFGTAVTFDVVNGKGDYVGGIIAPGLSAMTDYLHEKTALLPRIRIGEEPAVIGKNTRQAMRIGAVHGYRGLIRELVTELKSELRVTELPVVGTGGYAGLMVAKLPEITAVDPLLTLEGLRLLGMEYGML